MEENTRGTRPTNKAAVIAVVAVAAVATLFYFARGSFRAVYEEGQIATRAGSFMVNPHVNPLGCSNIAIIKPSPPQGMAQLQNEMAQELVSQLAGKLAAGHRVTIYPNVASAKQARADYYISAKPSKWDYSPGPLAKNWEAGVLVEGSPDGSAPRALPAGDSEQPVNPKVVLENAPPGVDASKLQRIAGGGRRNYRDLHVVIEAEGRTRGFFSASDLTSSVARSVVQRVVREIVRDGKEPADPYKPKGGHAK